MDDGFTQLQQRFIAGLPDRFDRMQQLCEALTDRHNDTAQGSLILLHREGHKLPGGGVCYRCPEIESFSASTESWLEQELSEPALSAAELQQQVTGRLDSLSLLVAELKSQH